MMDLPMLQESVESMLSRFGLREAAHGSKKLWHELKTLQEPDDPSPFGHFIEDESRISQFPVTTGISTEGIDPDSFAEILQREKPRAEETQDDTRGLSATASGTLFSSQYSKTLQDTRDLSAAAGYSLNVPDIAEAVISRPVEDVNLFEDILPELLIPEAVEEPQALIHEPEILDVPIEHEEDRDVSAGMEKKTCIVSPEKTPPPLSPEEPSSPLAERAMTYIKDAFMESDVPNLITFTSLINKTPGNRKYVAKLFSIILDLHASSVIFIEQPDLEGEIFISKGHNFYAF